jgi:hypothetical protein
VIFTLPSTIYQRIYFNFAFCNLYLTFGLMRLAAMFHGQCQIES